MPQTNFIETIINAKLTPYLFGFLGWILMWHLQVLVQKEFTALDYATSVSLIFLPAGIRTLSVLVFGLRGAVGVFLGCILSTIEYLGNLPTVNLVQILTISAISAFSAYLMMRLVCWWKKIGSDLDELAFGDVLIIVLTQGLLSSSLHQLVFSRLQFDGVYENASSWDVFRLWSAMATGDIIGSMVLMLSGIAFVNFFGSLVRINRHE